MKRFVGAYLTILAIIVVAVNGILIILYGQQLRVFGCSVQISSASQMGESCPEPDGLSFWRVAGPVTLVILITAVIFYFALRRIFIEKR